MRATPCTSGFRCPFLSPAMAYRKAGSSSNYSDRWPSGNDSSGTSCFRVSFGCRGFHHARTRASPSLDQRPRNGRHVFRRRVRCENRSGRISSFASLTFFENRPRIQFEETPGHFLQRDFGGVWWCEGDFATETGAVSKKIPETPAWLFPPAVGSLRVTRDAGGARHAKVSRAKH